MQKGANAIQPKTFVPNAVAESSDDSSEEEVIILNFS